jgi:hypothetical protein
MHDEEFSHLFPDEGAWRDPGDDAQRMAYYILSAMGLLFGPGATAAMLSDRKSFDESPAAAIAVIAIAWGISGFCGWFFLKERKHWDLRGMTADRVVAGLFVLAGGFGWLGVMFARGSTSVNANPLPATGFAWGIAIGVAGIAFIVGILYALWEIFLHRTRWLRAVQIIDKYAIDEALQRIDQTVSPEANGWQGVLVFADRRGRNWKMLADDEVYDVARSQAMVDLKVRGKRCFDLRRARV